MKWLKRGLTIMMAAVITVTSVPATGLMTAMADEVKITNDKITQGKTGKSMSLSFVVRNNSGRDIKEMAIGFDVSGGDIWDEDVEDVQYGYAFPFEQTGSLNDTENPKSVGKLEQGKEKTVSLSGRVRKDLSDGYYAVPVVVMEKSGDGWSWLGSEDIRVWISKSTSGTDEADEEKTYDFVLGESQSTPDGVYPEVLNFTLNMRNNSPATVYNVKASIIPDADTTKFPFEINDVNYDKRFDQMAADETVGLDYSFAIQKDAYSGYYPITMKIYYSTSSTGDELKEFATSFFVRVHNKDKEDETRDFNEHDRTKARIIADGYTTSPETIIAGEEFELVIRMKNASSSVAATNLLFTMESEKVSDSAVFTTDSGSGSVAIDSLGPGAVKEIRYRLQSKAGVDQRSYGLTIKTKFDSPEYKNAEESVTVDIPVNQIARLNTGTFDVMPDTINVGDEANIMFGVNNTGKVMLYNVMAKFEADSIQTTDTYVGNIKPGETGNVDCMVTGVAAVDTGGKVKLTISYEDENGVVSTEQKELNLTVTEKMPEEDINAGNFEEVPVEEPSFFAKYKKYMIPAAAGVVVLAVLMALVKRHKRKKAERDEEMEDENS